MSNYVQQGAETDVDFIVNLHKLTQEGKIKWHSVPPEKVLLASPRNEVQSAFQAPFNGQILQVTQIRVSRLKNMFSQALIAMGEPYGFSTRVEVLGEHGYSMYTSSNVEGSDALLEAIKRQLFNPAEFLSMSAKFDVGTPMETTANENEAQASDDMRLHEATKQHSLADEKND